MSWGDPVTAAYIGAVCTIVAPIIVLFIDRRLSKSIVVVTGNGVRQNALVKHTWIGTYVNETGVDATNKTPVNISFNFRVKRRRIEGEAEYVYKGLSTKIILEGGFASDQVLLLTYRNKQSEKIHVGTLVGHLNADLDELKGVLAGYGRSPDGIFTAGIELKRN